MATIKQLTTWKEAAENKLQKKIEIIAKHAQRAEKLLKEIEKAGGSAQNVPWNELGWKYRDAVEAGKQAEKTANYIRQDIERYNRELERKMAEEKAAADKYDAELEEILGRKLMKNRIGYIKACVKMAEVRWDHALHTIGEVEKAYNEAKKAYNDQQGYDKGLYEAFSAAYRAYKVLAHELSKTREERAQEAENEASKYYDACLKRMTTRLSDFSIDKKAMEIHFAAVTDNLGIEMLITDGRNRTISARLIWAAEDSSIVATHLRFIVTEKKNN